jgi:hypothetical protein
MRRGFSDSPTPLRAAVAALAVMGCTGTITDNAVPGAESGLGGTGAAASPGNVGGSGTGPQGAGRGGSGGASGSAGTGSGGGAMAGKGGSGAAGGSGPSACTSSASPGAPVPLRRLTATQVERTVSDVLGVTLKLDVEDERIGTYRSNISASVDAASARGYYDFAGATAKAAELSRCASDCSTWLLDEIGQRLFRRPLADAERTRYSALYDLASEDGTTTEAAEWVVEAMLQSPSFLYTDEVVKADGTLDDYALAGRLSLLLWGRNPDATLLDHAKNGALSTPAELEAEVTRLLSAPESEAGIREFVDQWLDLARLDDPDVRPDLADLGAATVNALRDEPVQYFRRLLGNGAALSELLTSSTSVAASELTMLYGDDILKTSGTTVELDPERRAGILSLPGVTAALSHARRTSPTLRGKAVLTGLLCTPPEPPPANVNTTLPEVSAGVSTRERLEAHMSSDACRGCHSPMDGIGFSLEKLDWLGRTRDDDNGVAINDTSTFPLGAADVTVTGAVELGTQLAGSQEVATCVSRQWLRYSLGVTETHDADCLVNELATGAQGMDGLEHLIVKALTSDWFRRGPGKTP